MLTPHYCRIVEQNKDLNLPPDRGDWATDIAHASIVYVDGKFAGILYKTNNGAPWYEDGLIGVDNSASRAESTHVLKALHVKLDRQGVGALIPLQTQALGNLVDGDTTLKPCY